MSRSATAFVAAALAAGIGIAALSASQETAAMFRGDAAHSGVYASAPLRQFGGLQWRVQTGGMVQSSAALHDGTLYIGSGDGLLYALDAMLPDLGAPTKAELEKAMHGHVLEKIEIIGTYERPK